MSLLNATKRSTFSFFFLHIFYPSTLLTNIARVEKDYKRNIECEANTYIKWHIIQLDGMQTPPAWQAFRSLLNQSKISSCDTLFARCLDFVFEIYEKRGGE